MQNLTPAFREAIGYFDPEFFFQDQNDPTRETPSRSSRLRGST